MWGTANRNLFSQHPQLWILSTPPPSDAYPPIPVTKVLLYDPWLEPLPSPGPTPTTSFSDPSTLDGSSAPSLKPSSSRPPEKMLVINSQVFSLWKDHFTRLTGVVDAWEPQGRRLLTLSAFLLPEFFREAINLSPSWLATRVVL